jgi:hypothetical protein
MVGLLQQESLENPAIAKKNNQNDPCHPACLFVNFAEIEDYADYFGKIQEKLLRKLGEMVKINVTVGCCVGISPFDFAPT